MFGFQEEESYTGITNLALDRILNIEETNENIRPDDVSWRDYFDEMIGVSKSDKNDPIKIMLRFDKERYKYVKTKPIHWATQKLVNGDLENPIITIEVIPNRELFQSLLSFGEDVEVLEPENIRMKMKYYTEKMLNFYLS